jgi:hypothetical protein
MSRISSGGGSQKFKPIKSAGNGHVLHAKTDKIDITGEETGEQPVKGHLAPNALQVHAFALRSCGKSVRLWRPELFAANTVTRSVVTLWRWLYAWLSGRNRAGGTRISIRPVATS